MPLTVSQSLEESCSISHERSCHNLGGTLISQDDSILVKGAIETYVWLEQEGIDIFLLT